MNFFEHIAATDDSERIARRKSSVIAAQRFDHQFGAFLKGANSKEDFKARLALIDSEIKEMTYDVAEEYGGDPQVIESAVRRHFLGAAHTVEERDGKYFVVEDGGAETVAGPFNERQEAQDRASELDELEPLEKKEAAMDNDQWRQAIEGLLRDIEGMYGEIPQVEYLDGQTPSQDLLAGLRDFVEYGYQGPPNPEQIIKGIFSDVDSIWGDDDEITEYAKSVLQNDWSDDTFADLGGNEGEEHYGSTKISVRRPKMCPYHSELTESSLQAGEPQYAAFSSLVGGASHCKGGFEGKCNFKPEMVTQEFWDNKAQQAAERKQLREQQQQEVVEIAEEPIVEEPVAESTELTDELSEAPSAVGEMSLEGESADMGMGEEAMALTAAYPKDRSNPPAARNYPPDPGLVGERPTRQYQPGNPVRPGDIPVSEKYPSATKLVDTVPGGAAPQLHPEEISGAGIPLDEDPYHMLTPEEVERIKMMREKAASEEDYYKDRSNPPVNRSNTTPKGAELNRYRSRGVSDIPVKPGDYTEGLTGEEITGAGIPIDQNIYHQITEEDVRRINLMREKAAKFASLKQAKDCSCWKGYKRVPGTEPCAPGSCEKCDSSKESSRRQANDEDSLKVLEEIFYMTENGEKRHPGMIESVDEKTAERLLKDLERQGLVEPFEEWIDGSRLGNHYNITSKGIQTLEQSGRSLPEDLYYTEREASRRQASERNANFAEFVNEAARMFPDAGASIETNDNGEIVFLVHDHLAGENATDQILELAQSYGLQAGDPDRMGYGPNAIFSGDIFPELSWQTGLLSDMPDAIFYAEGKTEREASRRQAEVAWDGGGANKNERGNWAWGHQEPKADESGLDTEPSGPAMDKTRWQPAALDPNGKGNLKPVDSEYPGSPNPTIQQVLWERREDEDVYGQQEFGDGINSVTDKQELPAADETGLTTEKNLDQGSQGGTFPNEGQANPVTSKVAGVPEDLTAIYDQLDGIAGGEIDEAVAGDLFQALAYIDRAISASDDGSVTGFGLEDENYLGPDQSGAYDDLI